MGNDIDSSRKKKDDKKPKNKINPKNSLAEQLSCPFCKREFKCTSTIKEFNNHTKRCGAIFIQNNKECELFPPSQDYELNKLIYENRQKYELIYKNKNNETFEKKIEILKNAINPLKISWQDGFCQLNLI